MNWTHVTTNWRTSALGGAAILGAIADGLHQIGTGTFDPVALKADATAFLVGWGLLMAKDSGPTSSPKP